MDMLEKKDSIWVGLPTSVKRLLEAEAAERNRSVGSLVYVLLHNLTNGFTDFSAADKPLISLESEVKTS